ncbi:chloride channel protein [Sodalis glossinidius]|uniref:chloride channel protein n=1 Tax=Sodalis glossinidius TaxID=63612 RepID=UPI00030DB18B
MTLSSQSQPFKSHHDKISITLIFHLALVVILTGIVAGISGMLLAMLLHAIQHLFFGYSLPHLISQESFLQGVTAPARRAGVLLFCGLVAGAGWWLIAMAARWSALPGHWQPQNRPCRWWQRLSTHCCKLSLALGSPLGREVAPREVGAGLAAVYNVLLAGALFVLEVLMGTFSFPVMIPALASCAIATAPMTIKPGR